MSRQDTQLPARARLTPPSGLDRFRPRAAGPCGAPSRASAEVQTTAVSMLDRAARKGLIHKNAAARQKSKLAKRAAAAAAAGTPTTA